MREEKACAEEFPGMEFSEPVQTCAIYYICHSLPVLFIYLLPHFIY